MGDGCESLIGISIILNFGVQTGTKQTYFKLLIFMGWCFYSHLVRWCTNRHQNKPIFNCLSLWNGAFSCILYFLAQTGTKTSLFLVIYAHAVVLLLASCTSVYIQAPKQIYFKCLFLWGGALSCILYFDVQTGTKTNLFLVVYVYGVVLLLTSYTSMYK